MVEIQTFLWLSLMFSWLIQVVVVVVVIVVVVVVRVKKTTGEN